MASSIALGRMYQGAVEGLDRTEDRRDRATRRDRADTEFEQGQQDREYRLERRGVEDKRADEQYKIQKDQQERQMAGNEALRDWTSTGDLTTVNEFMNKYTTKGVDYDIQKDKNGDYVSTMTFNGVASESKVISEDEIGQHMQLLMTTDPFAALKEQQGLDRASETKKADRAHDMAKIDREWKHRKDVEGIKAGAKGEGKDGEASLSRKRYDLSWQKELDDLATKDHGTLFGDQYKFDTTQEKAMKSAQADLGGVYYRLMEKPDSNSANRRALQEMRKFKAEAENQADTEIDEGQIEEKQRDGRIADIIDTKVDQRITELSPKPGESLQREGGATGETGAGGEDSDEARKQQAIELLEKDPSEKNKAAFNKIFGPDEAKKALGGSGGDVKGGGSGGLIKDANAAEMPAPTEPALKRKQEPAQKPEKKKPDYSGQKERVNIRKSQKDHQKIALSEYKNEWKNMSDEEKFDWFAENSGALKAKSERSYRKARKELRQIKSNKRFSQQNREDLKAGRENYTLKRGE